MSSVLNPTLQTGTDGPHGVWDLAVNIEQTCDNICQYKIKTGFSVTDQKV